MFPLSFPTVARQPELLVRSVLLPTLARQEFLVRSRDAESPNPSHKGQDLMGIPEGGPGWAGGNVPPQGLVYFEKSASRL